jgi:chaperonin GroEL (HSP60 family)
MSPKQLIFHDAARDKIRRGVDALAEAVKVTLGPRGRTVILERDFGPPQIVNSGVLVAKSIEVVVAEIKHTAKPCATSQEIAHVAAISANNDRSIASLILTTDCLIATAPKPLSDANVPMNAGDASPLF